MNASTVTSFAYNIAGAIAFALSAPVLGIGYSILGIGSATFHYYEERIEAGERQYKWAQRFDEVGMYLAFIPHMIFSLPIEGLETQYLLAILFAAIVAASYSLVSSFKAMPVFILIGLVGTYLVHSSLLALISAALFLAAVLIRNLSHSWWHIISTAAAIIWIIAVAT